eukprot:358504-Chlamydomonas_euryale.AAC.8
MSRVKLSISAGFARPNRLTSSSQNPDCPRPPFWHDPGPGPGTTSAPAEPPALLKSRLEFARARERKAGEEIAQFKMSNCPCSPGDAGAHTSGEKTLARGVSFLPFGTKLQAVTTIASGSASYGQSTSRPRPHPLPATSTRLVSPRVPHLTRCGRVAVGRRVGRRRLRVEGAHAKKVRARLVGLSSGHHKRRHGGRAQLPPPACASTHER